jgi:ABC-type branched-subunit amino acid transport system ATPase component
LTDIEGIELAEDLEEVEYIHVLCAQHEILFSNGAATESLYTGPQALKSISEAARQEIFTLFPELKERDYAPEPVRTMVPGRQGRTLAYRHQKNAKPLLAEGYQRQAA